MAAILLVAAGWMMLFGRQLQPGRSMVLGHLQAPRSVSSVSLPPVDCTQVACLALTFDDGPDPQTTPQIMRELSAAGATATFFVVGNRAARYPDILQQMYQGGFEIGNHSWNHANLTALNPEQIRQEVAETQGAILAAGVPAPTLFRPPYGAVNNVVRANVSLTLALWNNDPEDWRAQTPQEVVASVLKQAAPGRVVDLHDIDQTTVAALPQLTQELYARHYHLVTFSTLFNLSSNSRGEYFGR